MARALDYELLETAGEQYEAGQHLEAIQTAFAHLFPDATPDLSAPFSFTQGSSRVTVRIDDGVCFVSVPMVRLAAGGGSVAALRYALTRINGSGQLSQARLRGDDIVLEFREKLSSLHPQKLIEVLRRMPAQADQHDDWMVSQFGVTALERGHIEPLGDSELGVAEETWALHWTEVEELLKEAQRKRSVWFLNEVTAFAINRIRFTVPFTGSVLPRLSEAAGTFNDCDVDPMKRETTLAKFAREMKALEPAALRASFGHMSYAISPHSQGTPDKLSEYVGPGNYMETIERFRSTGHPMDAAVGLIGTYYYLLATHAWPEEVASAMTAGLAATSDKPWREAATFLQEHAGEMVETFCSDDEDEEEASE